MASPRHWWLTALLFASMGVAACPLPLPELAVTVAGQRLTAEVAQTRAALACGLSRRDHLAADHGMLFVFEEPVRMPFWMKDTRVPLSIAFIDGDGRIVALADMAPLDTHHRYRPTRSYRYALETVLGWFAAHGVGVGDRVSFDLAEAH